MKKIIVAVLAFVILVGFSAQHDVEAASKYGITNPNKNSHVIFYIPHQDDEALNFGVGIMNHITTGHTVHIVLLTDGSGAGVRKKLGMTELEFSEARNREFNYAVTLMGIKPENIDYRNYKDGKLTPSNVEKVIREYEKKYPKAKHKAYSYTDWHTDHKATGVALKKLVNAKVVSDARYYVRRGDNPKGLVLMKESFQEYYRPLLLAVDTAYSMENTRLGFYGIGRKSVPVLFNEFKASPLSRYHK
jgi:LmbE family N-acetylglucosaminyl deacetylase